MRRKTSGNTCARPISPTACSKTTPQSSTLASSHGVAFSTSSVASSPSPAVIGLLPVNHSEVWYNIAGKWHDGQLDDGMGRRRDDRRWHPRGHGGPCRGRGYRQGAGGCTRRQDV